MNKVILVFGILALMALAAGGGFLAGSTGSIGPISIPGVNTTTGDFPAGFDPTQFSQEQMQQFRGTRGGEGGVLPQVRGDGQGAAMAGGTMGTITAIEGEMVTVETQSGPIQVRVSDTTLIEKQMTVEVDDLEVGEVVVVSGSTGEDGITAARSIRVMAGLGQ